MALKTMICAALSALIVAQPLAAGAEGAKAPNTMKLEAKALARELKAMKNEDRLALFNEYEAYLTNLQGALEKTDKLGLEEIVIVGAGGGAVTVGGFFLTLPFAIAKDEAKSQLARKIGSIGLKGGGALTGAGLLVFGGAIAFGGGKIIVSRAEAVLLKSKIKRVRAQIEVIRELTTFEYADEYVAY
jgi:hypothetical protein